LTSALAISSIPSLPFVQQRQTNNTYKDVLLAEARKVTEPNTVAISLLRIEKQYNLLHYHGIQEYWKQFVSPSFFYTPTLESSSSNSTGIPLKSAVTELSFDGGSATLSSSKKAKVAFMITSAQRAQLSSPPLNYTKERIRKMTPTEALLILEYSIVPMDAEKTGDSRLEIIMKENEEFQRLEMLEAMKESSAEKQVDKNQEREIQHAAALNKEEELVVTAKQENDDDTDKQSQALLLDNTAHVSSSDYDNSNNAKTDNIFGHDDSVEEISSPDEKNIDSEILHDDDHEEGVAASWFEVVQVRNKDNNNQILDDDKENEEGGKVVALYRTEKEAREFISIKHDLRCRKKKTTSPQGVNHISSDDDGGGATNYEVRIRR